MKFCATLLILLLLVSACRDSARDATEYLSSQGYKEVACQRMQGVRCSSGPLRFRCVVIPGGWDRPPDVACERVVATRPELLERAEP